MSDYALADSVVGELDEIWGYIAKDNPEAAIQVVEAVYETFQRLANHPGLGRPHHSPHPEIQGLRFRPVWGYTRYLVLYREILGGIEILHVYHDARNISALLKRR